MANQRITDFTKVNNFSGDGDLIPIIINTGTVPINATITKANFIAAISLGSYVDVSTNQVVGGNKTFNGLVSLNGGVSFNLGSSTEFLKADGSVDSSTYLTLSDVPKKTYDTYLEMKADQANQIVGEYYRVINASDDPVFDRAYNGSQTYNVLSLTNSNSNYVIYSSDYAFTPAFDVNHFDVSFQFGPKGGISVSLKDGSQIGWASDKTKTSLPLLNGATGSLDAKLDRGRLILTGEVTTDSSTNNDKIIANLPVGARPSSTRYHTYFDVSNSATSPLLTIDTNGDIEITDGVGSITAIIDKEITLDY